MLAATKERKMDRIKTFIFIILILLSYKLSEATYRKIGNCSIPYWCRDLALIDQTILILDETGIQIIDVSDPEDPTYLNCYELSENCMDIEVIGYVAYIANAQDGLLIFDVSNPQNPQLISVLDTPDGALSLVVRNNIAYIADRHSGVQIIDVSNPYNPVSLGSYDTLNANNIDVNGNLAFISNYLGNIQVIDVSDPTSPFLVYTLTNTPDWVNDLKVIDQFLYVSTSLDDIQIFSINDPIDLNLIEVYQVPYGGNFSMFGDYLYLSNYFSGFQKLNITDPINPILVGAFDTPGSASNIFISEDIAYVSDQYRGLEIFDISDPFNSNLIGSVSTPNNARNVSVLNDIAYVTENDSYIHIIDLSNPFLPNIANSYGIYYFINGLLVEDQYALVRAANRLYVINIENCLYPEIISYIEVGNGTGDGALGYINNHVIVGTQNAIKIVRILDPEDPYIVSECETPDTANDMVVAGHYIYTTSDNCGLQIVNATNIDNPFLIVNLSTPISAKSLAKSGNILYIAGNYDGIYVVDIFDPTQPIFLDCITHRPDSRFLTKPFVHDNLLFVEDRNWNEILIFDISNPGTPVLLNTYQWNLSTIGFDIYENYLITVNGSFGISLLDLDDITSIQENSIITPDFGLLNYPNPFNPTTTIKFTIQNDSKVELLIFNIKGQKIKVIANDDFTKGSHSITWNGDDQSGNLVSSGIYFYKLEVNGKTEAVKKCLLLK